VTDNSADLKQINLGVMSGILLAGVSFFVLMAQLRLVIDFLPVQLAGVWFLFLSLGTYFTFLDLGFSPTLSREIAFQVGKFKSNLSKADFEILSLIRTCFNVFLVLSVVALLVASMGGYLFFETVVTSELLTPVIYSWLIFCVGVSLNIIGAPVYATLYGLGDVAIERLVKAVSQILGLVMVYWTLRNGFGLIGLSITWVAQNFIARAMALLILRARHPTIFHSGGKGTRKHFNRLLKPSLNWSVTTLAAMLILHTDNVIIASRLSLEAIPSYEVVSKIVMSLMAFSLLLVNTSIPFLSRYFIQGSESNFLTLTSRNCRVSLAAILFAAGFLAVFGDDVFYMVGGDIEFVGFTTLWILLALVVFEVHHVALASSVMATGHLVFYKMAIAAAIINVILSLILAGHYGVVGVALGSLIAQLMTNNWYAPYIAFKHLGISAKTHCLEVLVPALLFLLLISLFNLCLRFVLDSYESGLRVLLALMMSALLCSFLFFRIILRQQERSQILGMLKL
jgi:O-antigen/teichoic acid export membrane protein